MAETDFTRVWFHLASDLTDSLELGLAANGWTSPRSGVGETRQLAAGRTVAVSRPGTTRAASVSVITRDEIRAFGYQSVVEALSGQRGVYPTDDLSYSSIGVRGYARAGDYGNRVLVTMDGHTLTLVATCATVALTLSEDC